jgi:hypothetical protein
LARRRPGGLPRAVDGSMCRPQANGERWASPRAGGVSGSSSRASGGEKAGPRAGPIGQASEAGSRPVHHVSSCLLFLIVLVFFVLLISQFKLALVLTAPTPTCLAARHRSALLWACATLSPIPAGRLVLLNCRRGRPGVGLLQRPRSSRQWCLCWRWTPTTRLRGGWPPR